MPPFEVTGRQGTLASSLRLRHGERMRRYRDYSRFYQGQHFERPRVGRSALVLNYARAIVDKGVAYLLGRGIGYSVGARREDVERERRRAEAAEALLYDVDEDNDAAAVDLAVAQSAAVVGDGVYKVVFDPLEQRIRVLSVDPRCFFPIYAGDDAGRMLAVDLSYQLGVLDLERGAFGLSHADAMAATGSGDADVVERWTPQTLTLLVNDKLVRSVPNPYGALPFVHVPNLPIAGDPFGQSDLVDVLPINREIDERVSDQADIIRFHADPPVVFRGVDDHGDVAVGPGSVWDIPADADVKLLEWTGQPVAVGEHIERLYRTLYEVAETPRTAFGDSGKMLSGVALETELRPIIQRTLRKRTYWTRGLRQRARLVLRLARLYGVGGFGTDEATLRVRVVWPPMMPQDDAQEVRNQVSLVTAGLRSVRGAMDALGEEHPEEELARVVEDRATLGTTPAADTAAADSSSNAGGEGAAGA